MKIKIKKLSPDAKTPTYATDGSGCFDLYAINPLATLVHEGYPVTFDTGLAFEIPQGYGMFILSRWVTHVILMAFMRSDITAGVKMEDDGGSRADTCDYLLLTH